MNMPFRDVLASGKVKGLEIILWALSTHLFSALFYLLPSSYQFIVQNIGCFINDPLNEMIFYLSYLVPYLLRRV